MFDFINVKETVKVYYVKKIKLVTIFMHFSKEAPILTLMDGNEQ